jgi:methylated-DNA-[protein]-cysteine S-methyltransferase
MASPRTTPTKAKLLLGRVKSPIGTILVVCKGETLCALEFADSKDRMMAALRARHGDFTLVDAADPASVCTRIGAYLRGELDALDEIAVDGGGTEFQRKVWVALRRIAPGEVVSYGALAQRMGIPTSVRAVARANALNPVSIVVPCHRVIGSDGSLTGYGGGLPRKRWLLEHEGVVLPPAPSRLTGDRRYRALGPRP